MSEPTMKTHQPTNMDEALRKDILTVIQKHLFPNTPERVLAVAAQVVGQVLALQDPIKTGKDRAIAIIQANIEQGNQDYVALLVNQDKQKTGQTKIF